MRTLRRGLRQARELVGSDRPWRWALLVALALLVAVFEAVGAFLVYVLLALIATPETVASVPAAGILLERFPRVDPRTLQLGVAVGVAVFFVLRSTLLLTQAYVQQRVVHRAGAALASRLVRGYLAMPYLFHTQRSSAEMVRNTFDSAQVLVRRVLKPLVQLTAESLLVVAMVVVLLVVSPLATVLAVGGLGSAVWMLLRVVQPRVGRLGRRAQDDAAGSIRALQQALDGARDIILLRREEAFARRFERHRDGLARSQYLHEVVLQVPRALIETVLVLMIVGVFVASIVGGDSPETVLSTLGLFAYVGLRLQPSLRIMVEGLNDLRFSTGLLDDLSEDLRRVQPALDADVSDRGVVPLQPFHQGIELRGVSFRYRPDTVDVLDRVDLTVRAGEFLGVCGPTGGGKSTLVDLLVGLLPPTDGQVLVDGHDLAELDPTWWFGQVGMVSQTVFLADDTLRHNIAFGQSDGQVDDSRLRQSVQRAQLAPVVEQLPDGLETEVGERGVRLSGGQRQRVAIARALYLDPPVLVFDEGTSALDGETEAAVVSAIEEITGGHTMIAVAHRLSTVRNADRIVVVDGGRIVASGTHDELLEHSSVFRRLAQ